MAQAPNELHASTPSRAWPPGGSPPRRWRARASSGSPRASPSCTPSPGSTPSARSPRRARATARAVGVRGPLLGLPFGVKDIIDTHDMPTRYGSPIYAHHRPPDDAACVALAREAGAVMLGKTVTTEFALRHPGPTTNPHNPAHTPGGSSSGSAAAVADLMVPVAFGTQTGGFDHPPRFLLRRRRLQAVVRHDQSDRGEAARQQLRHGRSICPLRGRLRARRGRARRQTNGAPTPLLALRPTRVGLCRTPAWPNAAARDDPGGRDRGATARTRRTSRWTRSSCPPSSSRFSTRKATCCASRRRACSRSSGRAMRNNCRCRAGRSWRRARRFRDNDISKRRR